MTTVRVNAAALAQLVANRTDEAQARVLMGRLSGGSNDGNTLHDVFADFGYPEEVRFEHLWNMYRRFGIARSIIDMPVDEGWRELPKVEASAAFLRELDSLARRTSLWQRLVALDRRQRVGRYAGLFMRVKDGLQPHEPLDGKLFGESALMAIIPVYESEIKVLEVDNDAASENFGMPTMYQYSTGEQANRNERTTNTMNIHPSRLVVAAEGADNGSIYGIPAMEACFNSLIDLRKIIGAGGEGFYRNAAQSLVHSLREVANIEEIEPLLEGFSEQSDDFVRNRMRRSLWTPNMDTSTLDSALVQPKEFFNIALADVSACSNIPSTIIMGQQTGKLASTEDGNRFLRVIQSRRLGFQNELVHSVFGWLMANGILPADDYEIKWPDAMASSDQQKLANAAMMADINQKSFQSGEGAPFAGEEIREAAGYEPEELPEPSESLDDEDES